MALDPRARRTIAVASALGAALAQVLLVPLLPPTSILLAALAVLGGVLATTGITVRNRRLTEYPIGLALLGGTGVFLSGAVVATYDPVAWAALLGQLAVLALWGVAWSFRISDFEHDESRWNRAFVAGEHRRDTEWTERRQEMGPRWA